MNDLLHSFLEGDKNSSEFDNRVNTMLRAIKDGIATPEQEREIRGLLLSSYVRGMITDIERWLKYGNYLR